MLVSSEKLVVKKPAILLVELRFCTSLLQAERLEAFETGTEISMQSPSAS